MIEIKDLSKSFGKFQALKSVSLSLKKGECSALIGPNGCGKTSLIKCILGLVIPSEGEIEFEGKSIINKYLYRQSIGYMPQIGRYPENMSVRQIFEMLKEIRNQEQTLDDELYREYKLVAFENKKMRTLSGGMTQKVSAALSFLFNPSILILDEPSAGLDLLAAEVLKEKILRERKRGKLLLISSHLLSELDDLASEIIFMQAGEIDFQKSIVDLQKETKELQISKAVAKLLRKSEGEN